MRPIHRRHDTGHTGVVLHQILEAQRGGLQLIPADGHLDVTPRNLVACERLHDVDHARLRDRRGHTEQVADGAVVVASGEAVERDGDNLLRRQRLAPARVRRLHRAGHLAHDVLECVRADAEVAPEVSVRQVRYRHRSYARLHSSLAQARRRAPGGRRWRSECRRLRWRAPPSLSTCPGTALSNSAATPHQQHEGRERAAAADRAAAPGGAGAAAACVDEQGAQVRLRSLVALASQDFTRLCVERLKQGHGLR